jgi:hypothetical protein
MVDMNKRFLTVVATALLVSGAALAQTSGTAGVGVNGGASAGTGGTTLGTGTSAHDSATVKKNRTGADVGSSGSAGVGSSSGMGAGAATTGSAGVNPGGIAGGAAAGSGVRVPGK